METTVVHPGDQWPTASFNDDICQVPDFLEHVSPGMVGLVIPYHGADCHATFDFHYQVDDEARQLVYQVVDHYGGCRAGGHHYVRYTQVPAPPAGYEVRITFFRADD